MYNLDDDGTFDLLDADHAGHIWWHRNRGTAAKCDFETQGVKLASSPAPHLSLAASRTGFDALQGARATYAVGDFDRDGRADLVTTDTFGTVMYFHQAERTAGKAPTFDPGRKIAKLRIRGVPTACDWNGDGRLDIVAGSSARRGRDSRKFCRRRHNIRRAAAHPSWPRRPTAQGAPLVVADYNGDGDLDIILHTAYAYTCFYGGLVH